MITSYYLSSLICSSSTLDLQLFCIDFDFLFPRSYFSQLFTVLVTTSTLPLESSL